jgi:hypothetical protein
VSLPNLFARGLLHITLLWVLMNTASAAPPTADQVARATQAVASQPDWGGSHKERQWRFKPSEPEPKDEPKPEPHQSSLPQWLRWLAEGARVLMWLLGLAAALTVLVYAWRWMQVRAEAIKHRAAPPLSSHVQNLDIRPASLPDDIGAHAWALWQSGKHRAALSLLYRGALSRLVHQHRVPVHAAATEDECLDLAQTHLNKASAVFFETLVRTWQLAVYGGRFAPNEQVLALCDGFNAAWAPRPQQP